MPRQARKISSTSVYHVIVRGINKQIIFHDDKDYEKFMKIMRKTKENKEYKLFAYCMMNNHVHMVIQENKEPLALIMKRILISYAAYYNRKYKRIGPLFQDRFKSHPIEDEGYLNNSIRYIHQNPLRANLIDDPFCFKYSSAHEYYFKYPDIADIDFILELMEYKHFIAFQNELITKDELTLTPVYKHYSDKKATEIACTACGIEDLKILKKFPALLQDECIIIMLNSHIPATQICRITGMAKSRVLKLKSDPRVH